MALVALLAGSSTPATAKDLTQLSLDELMHLDVIQVTVPGAHFHYQGDYMIGFHYDSSQYGGFLNGSSSVSNNTVLGQSMMAETSMQQEMSTLWLMYGIRDDWTVDVMVPYMNMNMQQVYTDGFTTANHAEGLGDIYLGLIHPFKYHYPHQWQVELGFGLPTGNIDQFGLMTGMFGPQKLPYDMQLGSGSFTFQPNVSYLSETTKLTYGAQFRGYLPLNQNWDHYLVPNSFLATAWLSPQVSKHFSPSLRVDYTSRGNIRGEDPGIDFSMMPSSNPNLYKGSRADVYVGVNFNPKNDGEGHGLWVSLEYGVPFYQSLTGPQLKLNSVFSAAAEYTFK
jgi:hypothetical protein